MLGLTKEDVVSAKTYIRVLGFNEKGAAYLKQIKKDSNAVFVDDINSTERNHPELAKAIRTVVRAASAKETKKYMVEIVE